RSHGSLREISRPARFFHRPQAEGGGQLRAVLRARFASRDLLPQPGDEADGHPVRERARGWTRAPRQHRAPRLLTAGALARHEIVARRFALEIAARAPTASPASVRRRGGPNRRGGASLTRGFDLAVLHGVEAAGELEEGDEGASGVVGHLLADALEELGFEGGSGAARP